MKILYISCNPNPEETSACRQVGRMLLDSWVKQNPGCVVEELDLYSDDIPELDNNLITRQASLIDRELANKLPKAKKDKYNRITDLCLQFMGADRIIIAAPMWSLGFPSKLKTWLDDIILNGKTILIINDHVKGLLGGLDKKIVFVQSSGGCYAKLTRSRLNYANIYLKHIFKTMGINEYYLLPIEGTSGGKKQAIKSAMGEIPMVLQSF